MKIIVTVLFIFMSQNLLAATKAECLSGNFKSCIEIVNDYGRNTNKAGATRSNQLVRDSYGKIKKQLARYFPENIDAYYEIKDPLCDLIISSAFEWAKAVQREIVGL